MSASFADSARPPACACAWATKDGLYVELPVKGGPPYVTRYPKTVVGLTQALNVLIDNPAPRQATVVAHPKVSRPGAAYSSTQREAARAVLKRLKIT